MSNSLKYYIGFVIVVFLLFFGVKFIFSSPKKTTKTTPATTQPAPVAKSLPDYSSTDAEVSVTVSGPVAPDESHHKVTITISRNERVMNIYQGYNDLLIKSQSYDNNQAAYDVFLRAINNLGFTKQQAPTIKDERDACSQGTHYHYDIANTGSADQDMSLWSVSCGIPIGSAATGAGPVIRALFNQQIPDYPTLIVGIAL